MFRRGLLLVLVAEGSGGSTVAPQLLLMTFVSFLPIKHVVTHTAACIYDGSECKIVTNLDKFHN